MRDDYCDYFDYIQYKYDLSDRTCDIHEKINIVLNFIAIIALTIIAYIYKFSFINYIVFMIIGFVVFDIFCLLLEKILLANKGLWNKIKYSFKLLRFKRLDMESQLKIIKEKEQERKNIKNSDSRYLREELEDIDEELKFYKDNLKTIKEENVIVEDAITKRYLNDISYAEKILETLSLEKQKYSKDIQKEFDNIINLSKELIVICKNEPILIGQLMKTFNIYLVELIDIFNSYSKLNDEEKENNLPKVKLIFKELNNHLNELKTKVQCDSNKKFNNNADFLLQSLKETKKKEDKNV